MRGVVSLAAALSIPMTLHGMAFPQRSVILYITFIVILLTLLLQGLTLPALIKHIHFPDFGDYMSDNKARRLIRCGLAKTSLQRLHELEPCGSQRQSRLLNDMVGHWIEQLKDNDPSTLYGEGRDVYLNILERQRQWLNDLDRKNPRIDDHMIRHFIYRIDLEEQRLRRD